MMDKDHHVKLQNDHVKLQKDYDELKNRFDKLTLEYSENVIIQSMNDMKEKYNRLLQTTVPSHKYNVTYDKYIKIVRNFSGCSVLIDHICKVMKTSDKTYYSSDVKQLLYKIDNELIVIKDILEDSVTCNV